MAVLYRAQLTPTKLELLAAWLPGQPWAGAEGATLEALGAYRFDDPEGQVGIEVHLVRGAGGQVLQVPLTYRGAPLGGAEEALVGTMEHSVLGRRWAYDGCGDPVFGLALATAVLTGGTQADLDVVTDSGLQRRTPTTSVAGSGRPGSPVPAVGSVQYAHEGAGTVVRSGTLELTVVRALGPSVTAPPTAPVLTGTWPGQSDPWLLAWVA